jgi:hypothetical protein
VYVPVLAVQATGNSAWSGPAVRAGPARAPRPGGIADDVARAGPQRRQLSDQVRRIMLGKPGPQVVGAGQDEGPGLVDRRVRSARALRLATISVRIASTAPSRPFGAPRARPD